MTVALCRRRWLKLLPAVIVATVFDNQSSRRRYSGLRILRSDHCFSTVSSPPLQAAAGATNAAAMGLLPVLPGPDGKPLDPNSLDENDPAVAMMKAKPNVPKIRHPS